MPIYTVGHSNQTLEELVALLAAHGVAGVADVRRTPHSRRHPWFDRDALARALPAHALEYRHFEALGGQRSGRECSPHVGWTEPAFRAYADHMESDEFRAALTALLDGAAERVTAVMCAERDWIGCHRRVLCDALLAAGWEVRHILDAERWTAHRYPAFARSTLDGIVYDGGFLPLA